MEKDERRRFHRIATDKPVSLCLDGQMFTGKVLDASLHGLLFDSAESIQAKVGDTLAASVTLDDGTCCIDMRGEVAHVSGRRIGLRCVSMDIDSAVKLRRMVELNLDDNALLERDLAELLAG